MNNIEFDCFFEYDFILIWTFCLLEHIYDEEYNYLYILGSVCFLANIKDFDIVWWNDFNVDILNDFSYIRDEGCSYNLFLGKNDDEDYKDYDTLLDLFYYFLLLLILFCYLFLFNYTNYYSYFTLNFYY